MSTEVARTVPIPRANHTPTARRTAIHESGHAVVAYLLGRPFVEISIIQTDDSFGRVSHTLPTWFQPDIDVSCRTRKLIEQHVMVLLAGPEVEAAWCVRNDVPEEPLGYRHDLTMAVDLAEYGCGSVPTTEAYIEYLRQQVLDWVGRLDDEASQGVGDGDTRFWRLVNGLADALQAGRGTLLWHQARTVLKDLDNAWRRVPSATFASLGTSPSSRGRGAGLGSL